MSTIGDAIKAQAAHVKMINRKKNLSDYDELLASHCQVGDGPNHEPGMDLDDTVAYRPRKKRRENGEGSGLLPNEIEIIFKPHIEVPQAIVTRIGDNQTRYIKTLLTASIDHLCKYLKVRFEIDLGIEQIKPEVKEEADKDSTETETETENGESGSKKDEETDSVKDEPNEPKPETIQNMKIHVCQVPGQYIELTGPETLEMVVEDYWKVTKPMELHYQFDLGE